jgi:hypothetical protein
VSVVQKHRSVAQAVEQLQVQVARVVLLLTQVVSVVRLRAQAQVEQVAQPPFFQVQEAHPQGREQAVSVESAFQESVE